LLAEARVAAVVLAGALASFGAALVVERVAGLHADVVVLAVVLALTLGRRATSPRAADRSPLLLLTVPVVAVAAGQLATVMRHHQYLGDTLFALAVCGSVYVRRFGPRAAHIGAYAAMPFIAMLIVPVPIPVSATGHPTTRLLGSAAVALIAIAATTAARAVAARTGFIGVPQTIAPVTGRRSGRVAPSTRMAAQLGVALAAAFVVGHAVFGHHWPWPVLTAYILCSPNLGRADVLYRGVLRLAGAVAGMLPATLLAGTFAPGDARAVALIFVVLGLGTWLRGVNYAFWAAAVTAALSLLYGYYGDAGTGALGGRLGGILCGALIGVAASWLVLPVRTADVLRRRTATALAALSDLLVATRADPTTIPAHLARFEHALADLRPLSQPLRAQRLLTHRRFPQGPATVAAALTRALPPVRALTAWYAAHPGAALPQPAAHRRAAILATLTAARRSLRHPAPNSARQHPPTPEEPPAGRRGSPEGIEGVLAALAVALGSEAGQEGGQGEGPTAVDRFAGGA
jgi:hypothetical protein